MIKSVEEAARDWFAEARSPLSERGWDRSAYLDAAERLIRACAPFQLEDGTIRDPWSGAGGPAGERGSRSWMVLHSYAGTARYVGALARLLLAGRCGDLAESGMRALDWNARTLWEGRDLHRPAAEFELIELVDGLRAFGALAEPERRRRWSFWLGDLDPERCYGDVFSERPEPRNGNTFALASEQARLRGGLPGSPDFIDRYLGYQRAWFTPSGLYRDPGEPVVYDLTVRKNLSFLLHRGYRGGHLSWVEDVLERGGMASLFTQSAGGIAPFGGRSSQYLFVEATMSCVLEHEAKRYARRGDAATAGAFVRAARLALESASPWLAMEPPRHIRNGFSPETAHGIDSYGLYTVYAPLAATLFAESWHLADPSIPEYPCPAETGQSAFELDRAFHKVFASRGGWSIEVDTAADPAYDATGIGLVNRSGVSLPLALCAPLPARPKFLSAIVPEGESAAVGPAWRSHGGVWRSLAACRAEDIAAWDVKVEERAGALELEVSWRLAGDRGTVVSERVRLEDDGLVIRATVEGQNVAAVRFLVPVLLTDGALKSAVTDADGKVECRRDDSVLRAFCPAATFDWEPLEAVNRNGIYRVARWEAQGATIECRVELARTR